MFYMSYPLRSGLAAASQPPIILKLAAVWMLEKFFLKEGLPYMGQLIFEILKGLYR